MRKTFNDDDSEELLEIEDIDVEETFQNNSIDELDELNIFDEGESNSLPDIRLELDGVSTEEELVFIKSKASGTDAVNDVPFYISFGLDLVYVCKVDLTIDLLMNLKFIGLNHYTLVLIKGSKRVELLRPNIDDDSVEMLMNFIRIGGCD